MAHDGILIAVSAITKSEEFKAVNDMYLKYFKIFGLEKYQMRFSTSAPEGLGVRLHGKGPQGAKTAHFCSMCGPHFAA